MQLKINTVQKPYIERTLLIFQLGILEGLKNGVIKIDEAELFMFNLYFVGKLKEHALNDVLLQVSEEGCELEDIESLIPDRLADVIQQLIDRCKEALGSQSCIDDLPKERILTFTS